MFSNIRSINFNNEVKKEVDDDLEFKADREEAIRHVSKLTHEYYITMIIPLNSFKVFIEIMAWDMRSYQKLSKYHLIL